MLPFYLQEKKYRQLTCHNSMHIFDKVIYIEVCMKVGEIASDFSLLGHDGKRRKLSDYRGKKTVVVFFYPKDDTPG